MSYYSFILIVHPFSWVNNAYDMYTIGRLCVYVSDRLIPSHTFVIMTLLLNCHCVVELGGPVSLIQLYISQTPNFAFRCFPLYFGADMDTFFVYPWRSFSFSPCMAMPLPFLLLYHFLDNVLAGILFTRHHRFKHPII